jgi:hypothetical protein
MEKVTNDKAIEAAYQAVKNEWTYFPADGDEWRECLRKAIEAYERVTPKEWDVPLYCEENTCEIADTPLYMALSAMGIYPKAFVGGENAYESRTDFMEGWNSAVMTILRNLRELEAAMRLQSPKESENGL